jgi:8-oxo-dGTP diphosphatase
MSHIHALLRCSVVVFSPATNGDRVLLVRRRDKDDWALPGGTPRPGEDLLACARRELQEETGMLIDPGTCALIIETVRPYSARLIDLVFLSPTRPVGQPHGREDGLTPRFVPLAQLNSLTLHPPVARHLHELHNRRNGTVTAEYLRHEWRSQP